MLNSNLIPKWRQKRLLRTTKRNGHDYPKRANVTFRRDSDCDINEEAVEVNDIIETMLFPAIFRTKWSKNLTDKVTEDMTDEEKLTFFLADFLRIKAETAMCDKGSSDVLNLIASFMPTVFKCPRTIEGCRSFVRNKVPDVAAIYDEAEEVLVDEARILLMPFNKTVKHVVKKNLEFLLPQTNENGIIDINLQLHTDGVEITKSSKLKIWPLSAVIENLPGKIRISKSNVIIIAIHLSDKTPDFKAFCERFVRDFNSGIQVLFHRVNDDILQTRTVKYRVRCNMLTGDIPAIRSILNLQGHACQYGCIHCYCESVTARSVFGNGNKRTYVSSETFALRTNDSYKQDLNEMTTRGLQASFGVKGMSYLADLIKVPEDVAIDYFHTVLLGPFKEDILRIVNSYMSLNKENSVVKTVKVPGFIDRQFSHFKQAIEMSIFPSEFKRKLKPLTELDSYKGIEWKNLMLYALPTVMSDICNGTSKPLYLVILSLANAVIVLMKDNVNAMEIKKSQEQLYQWFTDRTAILDNDAMTLKAHQITHLAEIVERHGSLCHYSCFFGEGLGYNLTRMISLKTLDKSLNQLKTRLTDYSVINSIIDQMEKKVPRESKSIDTRMCVRDFCHHHFVDSSLEVQEISEFHFKSYLIKPAYDMPFTKDSFVAYKSDQSNFKCAIGVVKSVVSVDTKIWMILKPLKIKSTIFDKFPVNSNDIILDRIKENTMFDHYFCLEEYMPKEEMTAYRPMSYFAKEKSHLVVIDVNAILYKCLIINTPGEKSICCPIIAPFEHN
uniref:MYND-type domain-containing protein n=1 Tax=Strongyloides papillosus TaxID=174720 RepID=A0A0N5C5G7_STREA